MSLSLLRVDTYAIVWPSGETVGEAFTESRVSWVRPVPSRFTVQICCLPAVRAEWNTNDWPSGVNAGRPSGCGSFVTRGGPVPSAFMAEISALPSPRATKAVRDPSGENTGRDA